MKQYAGLDVSLKETAICVVAEDGEVLIRGSVATEPRAIAAFLAANAPDLDRVVHESGMLSTWLTRDLEMQDVPIVCIDARQAHKALSARLNKSDTADAEGLAHLARTGWYRQVHIRSEAADRLRTLLGARERLIRLRKDLEAHSRGVLRTFGIRLAPITSARNRANFREQLAEAASDDGMLGMIAEGFIPTHEVLCQAIAALDAELRAIARTIPVARRLMTVPGVGVMVALSFIATVDDPGRFRRAADVGAFLGLTPRRYQSGETDYTGRISKCGSTTMRTLLFEAAACLIRQVRRFSPLKSWAVRLAGRRGFKKAAIATARKLSVLLLAIWRDGTEFEWKKEAAA
jgi:transposase